MKLRRVDSKAAVNQQRANVRRGARGKQFVGQDTGAAAGKAAEVAKVRRMQEVMHAREEAARLREPLTALVADLVVDSARLARTVVTLPFRMVAALRGHRPAEA